MSPALLVCAAGVCMTAIAGLMVAACMVAEFVARWIDGRRHGP